MRPAIRTLAGVSVARCKHASTANFVAGGSVASSKGVATAAILAGGSVARSWMGGEGSHRHYFLSVAEMILYIPKIDVFKFGIAFKLCVLACCESLKIGENQLKSVKTDPKGLIIEP